MSLPPPALKQIITLLRKQARKLGGSIPSGGHIVRGLIQKTDKDAYQGRGPADDAYRFLRNQGILVEDEEEGRFYIDEDQAEAVRLACDNHTEAPKVPDPMKRLKILMSRQASEPTRTSSIEVLAQASRETPTPEPPSKAPKEGSVAVRETAESEPALEAPATSFEPQITELLTDKQFLDLTIEAACVYLDGLKTHLAACEELFQKLERLGELKRKQEELVHALEMTQQNITELMAL